MFPMEKYKFGEYSADWTGHKAPKRRGSDQNKEPQLHAWSVWSKDFVGALSNADPVEGVWALGSVLAISMKDLHGGGMFYSCYSGKAGLI